MKNKIPHEQALEIAQPIIEYLKPHCKRLEIAGSLRRQSPQVGDIELCAIPNLEPLEDLFGSPAGYHSALNDKAIFSALGEIVKSGPRYTQINLPQGLNLDLFCIIPPAQWGVIYTIRTGNATFSQWLVTPRNKRYCFVRGALPSHMLVRDGQLWAHNWPQSTPEEIDFFNQIKVRWIPPHARTGPRPDLLHIV